MGIAKQLVSAQELMGVKKAQAEEFDNEDWDIANELYLPILKQEELYSDPAVKVARENNIDTAELVGVTPDPNAGLITSGEKAKFVKGQATPELEEGKEFIETMGKFIKNTSINVLESIVEGGLNTADVAVNMLPLFNKAFQYLPAGAKLPEEMVMDQSVDLHNKLQKLQSNLDENGVFGLKSEEGSLTQDLIGIVAQDLPISIPIYNKFKKFMPKYWAAAFAFGIGGALAFDEEKETTFFLDTEAINGLKHLVNILPDTPEE